jgi:hypothetical protein
MLAGPRPNEFIEQIRDTGEIGELPRPRQV